MPKPAELFAVGQTVHWFSRRWHSGTILAEVPPHALPDLSLLPASYRVRFKPDKTRVQRSYLVALDADRPSSVTYVYRPYLRTLRALRTTQVDGRGFPRPGRKPLTGAQARFLFVAAVAVGALLGALYVGLRDLFG